MWKSVFDLLKIVFNDLPDFTRILEIVAHKYVIKKPLLVINYTHMQPNINNNNNININYVMILNKSYFRQRFERGCSCTHTHILNVPFENILYRSSLNIKLRKPKGNKNVLVVIGIV